MKTILANKQLALTIQRLAHQLIENHYPFTDTVVVGIQPRGVLLADQVVQHIRSIYPDLQINYGKLDITFYRDDAHRQLHVPQSTSLPFAVENKRVILIDDVLYTGRTIRAAMDALVDYGRPASIELCVLIDRRFNRQVPIQPDYSGRAIDSLVSQKVSIDWSTNTVYLN
ncbi:MAG: bifunctional pyr operon transcriptional regulator/uracil phosphoribosyltransferase PyrR [Chitinophagaceae bacterium]